MSISYWNEICERAVYELVVDWYDSNIDGDWEHHNLVCINTTAHSTWEVKLSVTDTALDDHVFDKIEINRSSTDWIRCEVVRHQFYGYGGLLNLPEILHTLITWAKQT